MTQIQKIQQMSQYLIMVENAQEEFKEALENFTNSQKLMKKLSKYYFGKAWRKDYESDEKGKIPKDINRASLSEDGIYNAFCENRYFAKQMQKLAKKILKEKQI